MGTKTLRPEQRRLLFERTGGACEWCGRVLWEERFDAHHRQLRSRGGTWALSNLVAVHPECHTNDAGSIHMHPRLAKSRGFMVSAWADPRAIPVEVGHVLYWLLDDGAMTPVQINF